MFQFGNPEPMPTVTIDDVGSSYESEVIEVANGYVFDCCEFNCCEFTGRGPVEFRNCKFFQYGGYQWNVDHAYFFGCTFVVL